MRGRKLLIIAILSGVISGGTGWMLFGWETKNNPSLGIITLHRKFGRVTMISVDNDLDGKAEAKAYYWWSFPYQNNGQGWREIWEDRNNDGKWDTWLETIGDGTRFKVDLNGDETPDWEFNSIDSLIAYEDIREKRGY